MRSTEFLKNKNLKNSVDHGITYYEICAGDQIKYCRTAACKFSKDNISHRLMNYLNTSSDCIGISHPVS